MLFTEFQFIFYFLPVVLTIYALLPQTREKLLFLFLSSLFFYGFWDVRFLPLLLGSITLGWWMGEKIDQTQDAFKRKKLMITAVTLAIVPLIYFKYSSFIAGNLGLKTGYDGILPLGISFYTFQQITYIISIYQRKFPASHSFLKYAFIVTFFPHLIAGPILFYKDIVGQIGQVIDRNKMFAEGCVYFVIGLIKKFLIADSIALLATPVFTTAATDVPTMADAWTGMVGYTLQLYFDFSGYSDMAVGLGLMFGYRLPTNFMSPYQSRSLIDFWRRWHMTLSGFLRDYVYIPLGGNKKRRYVNLMLTMLIGGLWHGASWTFILWGGLHGLGLVLNHTLQKIPALTSTRRLIGWPVTFMFVALCWVLFRAENFDTAMNVYRGLLTGTTGFTWHNNYIWMLLGAALIFAPNSHAIAAQLPQKLLNCGGYMRGFMERRILLYILLAQILWYPAIAAFYQTDFDRKIYAEAPIEHSLGETATDKGDYRANLFSNAVFTGEERKIIIAGSSYTRLMGDFNFTLNGIDYRSGSVGMGGNNIYTPLRSAFAVLDTPQLDTLIVAVSALNMTQADGIQSTKEQKKYIGAFPYQCIDNLQSIDLPFHQDILSSCAPLKRFGIVETMLAVTIPGSSYFYQLHGFLQKMGTWGDVTEKVPLSFNPTTYKGLPTFEDNTTLPTSKNGNDAQFKWSSRATLKTLAVGGEVYNALGALADAARAKNVKLVIYSTPTVSTKDAPWSYPSGFHAQYEAAITKATADHGIIFYDLSHLLPWQQGTMRDFIHPTVPMRQELHKFLLAQIIKDGHVK